MGRNRLDALEVAAGIPGRTTNGSMPGIAAHLIRRATDGIGTTTAAKLSILATDKLATTVMSARAIGIRRAGTGRSARGAESGRNSCRGDPSDESPQELASGHRTGHKTRKLIEQRIVLHSSSLLSRVNQLELLVEIAPGSPALHERREAQSPLAHR